MITMQLQSILILWCIIMFLTLIHEFGHFFVARMLGLPVACFAIGFGPHLLSYKDKKSTTWCFNLIPLGGYVAMSGEDNETDAMLEIHPIKRIFVSLGGPVVNILFFLFGACLFFHYSGIDTHEYQYLNETYYVSHSKQYVLHYNKNRERFSTSASTIKNLLKKGTSNNASHRKLLSFSNSYRLSIFRITSMTKKFIQIFTSWKEVKNLKSIIVAQKHINNTLEASKNFREQVREMIFFLLIFSLNLGLFNLLPIVGLDGFWVLISFINIFFRPKLSLQRKIIVVINYGTMLIFVIFGLMLFRDLIDIINEYFF
jgi:membrane-associated protease RseP (regulator of RpoE activity)